MPTQFFLCFSYGHKRILGGGLINPFIKRGYPEQFQKTERPDHRSCWKTNHFFTKTGFIKNRLIILAHSGKFFGSDIESVIHKYLWLDGAKIDRFAQIFHIKKLIAVLTVADERKIMPIFRPIVKKREYAQPFRTDE